MEQEYTPASGSAPFWPKIEVSTLAVSLLKGVLYQEQEGHKWDALLTLQSKIRDYMNVLGLELVLDEAEGYAFLKSGSESEDGEELSIPRLIARRRLSFPVSLVLALLRRKLAEFDAGGGDTRLVLSNKEIFELARVFLPDSSNEARLADQIDAIINKIVELGFLRPMKSAASDRSFEVRRILKAFVDAQWLKNFDERLAAYRAQLAIPQDDSECVLHE